MELLLLLHLCSGSRALWPVRTQLCFGEAARPQYVVGSTEELYCIDAGS